MPNTQCCVPGCNNKGGHSFPGEKTLRDRWAVAVKRCDSRTGKGKLWQPSRHSVVCCEHFKEDDYIKETFYGLYGFKYS